jgi:Peptidase family M48
VDCGAAQSICSLVIGICLIGALPSAGQQAPDIPAVPFQFKLDMETAARLRPQLMSQSVAPSGRYAVGRLVFDRLVAQILDPSRGKFAGQLRIVDDNQLNAYSSPDGAVYVESGLARLAGASSGLWAAILSHEIAHILRRDWARRYLYQKYLEHGGGTPIVLGDRGLPSADWQYSEKASADMGRFSRQMELDADQEGLMMMARAGYHPDFVPALHHLLHAHGVGANRASIYAMHPCWEERDRDLNHAYVAASIEFARRWPEWFASPGGNPPVVVFADEPTVRKTAGKDWQIQIPMRCQNLAGAVEVVLSSHPGLGREASDQFSVLEESNTEARQLTGCTSPKTMITFTLAGISVRPKTGAQWTDVYVLDASGSVLARADLPKLPH